MKRKYFNFFIYLLIIICIAVSVVIKEAAADGKIKLTTCDLHKTYIIKGLVHAKTGQPDLDKINKMLIKEAKKIDADCIVGVSYMEAYGYLFGYGTAVKVK